MPTKNNTHWLHRTFYLETLKVYSKVWDLYIKFYTVFLTSNVVGIGIALKYLPQCERLFIAIPFCLQNVITAFTSWSVARYSLETDDRLKDVARSLADAETGVVFPDVAIKESPVARRLSARAGYANCFACALHIGVWVAVCLVPGLPGPNDERSLQRPCCIAVPAQKAPTATQPAPTPTPTAPAPR